MTLVELLTAEAIGGVVITVAIMLVISSFTNAQRVSDRVNSMAQGRVLAAQIEQRINSQVCLYSGEYAVNGTTVYTGAADSIVFAGPTSLVFFADINKNGATSATSSVGFTPYMRYLYFQQPTSGTDAGRKGAFYDGYRSPSTSAIPFSYALSPLTGADALEKFGATEPANVPPTTTRKIVEGVSSDVSGTTRVPFFQYWNTNSEPITPVVTATPTGGTTGAVPVAELPNIGRIKINFRILAESGKDTASFNTSKLDNRTASFSSDIYLRTNPSICG